MQATFRKPWKYMYVWLALLLIGALALSACGEEDSLTDEGDETIGGQEPTEASGEDEEAEEETPEEDAGGAGEGNTLEIYNYAEADICTIYVSPSDASEWGDNLLQEPLAYEAGIVFEGFERGSYDLYAADCDDNTVQEELGNILGGASIWEIGYGVYGADLPEGGDEDSGGEEPGGQPSGEGMLADTGFAPNVNGFSFENFGNEYDPDGDMTVNDLREIFGDGVCASIQGDACLPNPNAQQFMDMVNESNDGGHCAGFSVQAMRQFLGNLSPSEYGGSTTFEIEMSEDILHDLGRDFALQFLPEVTAQTIHGSPAELVNHFIEVGEPMEVGIYGADGGHSVVAYGVRDMGNNIYHLLVYDNNYPGQESYIEVDMAANTWVYSLAALNPAQDSDAWGGGAGDQTMELVAFSAYTQEFACQFCAADAGSSRHARPSRQGSGTVYVSAGKAGDLSVTAPDAVPIMPRGVRVYQGPPVYLIPADEAFNVEITGSAGKASDDLALYVVGPTFSFAAKRLVNNSGVVESVSFSNNDQGASYTAGADQRPVVTIAATGADGAYYLVTFTGADFGEGDAISLGMDPESGALLVDGQGLEDTALDLILARIDSEGADVFAHSDITLGDDALLGLDLAAWDGEGALDLLTDADGDGEFEGSEALDDEPLAGMMEGLDDSEVVLDLFGDYAPYMDEEDAQEYLEGLEGLGLSDDDLEEAIEGMADNSDEPMMDEAEEDSGANEPPPDEGGSDGGDDDGGDGG